MQVSSPTIWVNKATAKILHHAPIQHGVLS